MRHPIDSYNEQQAAVLATLPPDKQEATARLFRIGNATYYYHNQLATEPTKADYAEWLAGLPHEGLRQQMIKDGFEKAWSVLSFRRYIQEKNDIGLDEFMRHHLTEDDYNFYDSQYTAKPSSS